MGGAVEKVETEAQEQQHNCLHFMLLSAFHFAVSSTQYQARVSG
jgi:hypothetical protein